LQSNFFASLQKVSVVFFMVFIFSFKLCHGLGSLLSVSHYNGPGSRLGQSMLDFCGRNGTERAFSPSSSVLTCQYHSTMALHISSGG
jgi:hypothetical protein